MEKLLENSLKMKVSLIPEEGIDNGWSLPPDIFSRDLKPIAVKGPVNVEGRLYRTGSTVHFEGQLSGALLLECSRCLESFELPIKDKVKAIFIPSADMPQMENEMEIHGSGMDTGFYEGDEINLYEPLRDQMALATPIQPVCDQSCKGLCQTCGKNLNESWCDCRATKGDPRLAKLKQLKFE